MSPRQLVVACLFLLGCFSLPAAEVCCPSTPERELWGRFAVQAQAVAARGGNPLPALSPPPEGITDLSLADLFSANHGGGLEYSPKALALAGKQVRVQGFMVSQQVQTLGQLLFTARPYSTHETEDGLCDDLPAATLCVIVKGLEQNRVPLIAGPLALIGTLELGSRSEKDGRNSVARLVLSESAVFSHTTPLVSFIATPIKATPYLP